MKGNNQAEMCLSGTKKIIHTMFRARAPLSISKETIPSTLKNRKLDRK